MVSSGWIDSVFVGNNFPKFGADLKEERRNSVCWAEIQIFWLGTEINLNEKKPRKAKNKQNNATI